MPIPSRAASVGIISLALLALFQWVLPALGVPPYILPTPSSVFIRAINPESRLLFHIGITLLEIVVGFTLGGIVGIVLALLFIALPPLEDALYPWIVLLQTIPLVALAPLFVLWFGNGWFSRALMASLFALFPILVNATRGLRAVDSTTHDLMAVYGASAWHLLHLVRVPASLPFLFAGLRVGATMAIIGAIVAEMTGASQGLGYLVTVSTYRLETDLTFAAALSAALVGMGFYTFLIWLERRVIFWQKASER